MLFDDDYYYEKIMEYMNVKKVLHHNNKNDDFHYICLTKDVPSGQSGRFSISNE
jgi:hypothetical protein